ncbi:MAG: hypothetical protein IT308_00765 [Anaerolineaceae bacterium]|nr:hypothetical protein [Anaerolineaceae bacterium]
MEDRVKVLMERLVELEADVLYRQPAQEGEEEFRHIPGTHPVLVSAPHGAAHLRNGNLKEEDEYTAAIACYLAERTGAHALYLRRRVFTDSNYDRGTNYKQAMSAILRAHNIRFVLDLHGASDRHAFGMALGTMNGRSCPKQISMILEVLGNYGFKQDVPGNYKLDVDGKFTAAGGVQQETITRFVRDTLGVAALQVELTATIRTVKATVHGKPPRVYRGDPVMIADAVGALEEAVRRL